MNYIPFVSIIVTSFNRADIVNDSLISLINLNYNKDRYEIIFFDNDSIDETKLIVEEIKSKNPLSNLKIIYNDSNYGSSGSYKRAIKYTDDKWDYILKIDEDVILENNTLQELVNVSENAAIKGFVGGKIKYYENKNLIQATGSYLRSYFSIAKGININTNDIDTNNQINTMNVEGVNGCMALIPREIYEKVGWFDDSYFLYYDDHELMYKAIQKGFLNYYNPKAIAYHATKTGNKLKYKNKIWLYYSIRGSIIFLKRNFDISEINYYVFFLSTNIKFVLGIFNIIFISNKNDIFSNIYAYFLGYYHGITGKEGKNKR